MTPGEEALIEVLNASQQAQKAFLEENDGLDRAFNKGTLGEFIRSNTTKGSADGGTESKPTGDDSSAVGEDVREGAPAGEGVGH